MSEWYPTGAKGTCDLPPVGSLVAIDHRVVEVWAHHPRDDGRVTLAIRRLHGPPIPGENSRQERGFTPPAGRVWQVYISRRVPVCSDCGEPWPCRDDLADREAIHSLRVMAGQIAKAEPGLCYSCGEHITPRQAATTAPEPNVELPGFGPPQFHLRLSCRHGLDRYEKSRRRALGGDWTPLIPDAGSDLFGNPDTRDTPKN